jgi:hypothetical protein
MWVIERLGGWLHITRQGRVFADDTPLPTLERGRRRTRIGRLWAYAVDDRPWQGGTLPAVAYVYSGNRRAEHPGAHLAAFRGVLQVDGYDGFKALRRDRDDGEVVLAFCWAHLRRRFFDIHAATQSPIAAEALLRIAALYAIEAGIRGSAADRRLAVRQAQSAPLVAEFEAWLHAQLNRLSRGSKLAEAIRYGLRHWQGLSEFLSDGRLEMDTNTVERDMVRRLGAARDTLWIAELTDSIADCNRCAIWGAMNAAGEDAAISRDSLPLASRMFRLLERIWGPEPI